MDYEKVLISFLMET